MEKKLTNAKSIRSFLDAAIKESLENVKRTKLHSTALDEKDKQQSLAAATAPADTGDESLDDALGGDGGDSEGDDEEQADPSDDSQAHDKEALAQGEVSSDDVIDKLNTIRSGKSFKDSAIKSAMEKYVNDLDDAEKTALLAFLKGISQIVTGEIPGETATEPADNPSSVKMQKEPGQASTGSSPHKKTIKPNIIRSPGADQSSSPQKQAGRPKNGAEDTSGPMPVRAKRRADRQ